MGHLNDKQTQKYMGPSDEQPTTAYSEPEFSSKNVSANRLEPNFDTQKAVTRIRNTVNADAK
jgi:hypothetical protein